MSRDIECPYCGEWNEVCHDDGQGYAEDELHQMECSACKKSFVFTTTIHFSYYPQKADCLNDAEHDYKRTKTYPKWAARDRCAMCGDEKLIPEEEKRRLYAEDNGGVEGLI